MDLTRPASAAEIADVIERCPSGALQYVRADGTSEVPPAHSLPTATDHGPILLHGKPTVAGRTETRIALCAYGRSTQQPRCDNTCRS